MKRFCCRFTGDRIVGNWRDFKSAVEQLIDFIQKTITTCLINRAKLAAHIIQDTDVQSNLLNTNTKETGPSVCIIEVSVLQR